MLSQKLVIECQAGLHARPLSKFMQKVKTFKSDVVMVTPKGEVNCRSIVGLLGAAVKKGTEVELRVNGPDEDAALPVLVNLLDSLADEPVEMPGRTEGADGRPGGVAEAEKSAGEGRADGPPAGDKVSGADPA
ncbi:MAG: HPr family phosphocarrier protein [Deltaproteobacteria bacterium]|jgi:phosphocarrier protein|nr:HPr family phosphocarrier protein [Deltaproteobacteria bacterium]